MNKRLCRKRLIVASFRLAAAASLLSLTGCSGNAASGADTASEKTDTAPATAPPEAGTQLQTEDYKAARSHFQTKLARQEPAPQDGEALRAPAGA